MQSMNNGRGVVDTALNAAGNRAVQAVHPLATHSNMVGLGPKTCLLDHRHRLCQRRARTVVDP
jgi:hypothetical protein